MATLCFSNINPDLLLIVFIFRNVLMQVTTLKRSFTYNRVPKIIMRLNSTCKYIYNEPEKNHHVAFHKLFLNFSDQTIIFLGFVFFGPCLKDVKRFRQNS